MTWPGGKMSEEHKAKLRVANTGRKCTPETRAKIRLKALGRKMSDETRKKSSPTMFKKGRKPWNKGKKNPYGSEEKSPRWKGDDITYSPLHQWVAKWKGKPKICEKCGRSDLSLRQYHWANIDHKYRRVLDDYIRLCLSCHKEYDKELKD